MADLYTVIIPRINLSSSLETHHHNSVESLLYEGPITYVRLILRDRNLVESPTNTGFEFVDESLRRHPSTLQLAFEHDNGSFKLRYGNRIRIALYSLGLQHRFHDQVIEYLLVKANWYLASFGRDFDFSGLTLRSDIEIQRISLPEIGGGSSSSAAERGGGGGGDEDVEVGDLELALQGLVSVKQGEKGNCVICLEDLLLSDHGNNFGGDHGKFYDVVKLPNCTHVFHGECIQNWFVTNDVSRLSPTCPVCRSICVPC